MGRRPVQADSRWDPRIYHSTQCTKKPRIGALCELCHMRAEKGIHTSKHGWEGRVDDTNLNSLPMDSRIAGSDWFFMLLEKGNLTMRGQTVVLGEESEQENIDPFSTYSKIKVNALAPHTPPTRFGTKRQ